MLFWKFIVQKSNYSKNLLLLIIFCSLSVSFQPLFAAKAQVVKDVTLYQFSQIVAKKLDYAIIFSPRVRKNSKIALVLSKVLEPDQLYNVFLGLLNVQGYAAVRSGNLIRVVREYKARTMYSD